MNLFNKPAPYRLIVRPDEIAREKAGHLIQQVSRTFHLDMEEAPVIQVAAFDASSENFSIMSNWLMKSFRDVEAFTLVINNLSGIPPSQVHLRVQYSTAIGLFRHRLNRLNQIFENYSMPVLQQPARWVLPLTHSVVPSHYSSIMLHLSKTEFQLEMPVKQVIIEKKDSDYDFWHPVQRISLAGPEIQLPVSLNACLRQEATHLHFW